MTTLSRRDFIQKALAVGISYPLLARFPLSFSAAQQRNMGKVLIVGAGAAGLTAGYLLTRLGVDVQIVEASSRYGGRVKRLEGFTSVPLDLGAEWIHTEPGIFTDIVDDPNVQVDVDTIVYNPKTISNWVDGRLRSNNWISNFYSEYKFKHGTWYGFFERYITPSILDKITFDSPVTSIDYSGETTVVSTAANTQFEVDKVLVTAPVTILQSDMITFTPPLPSIQQQAINNIYMGDGIKAFIKFSERFYPDLLAFGSVLSQAFAVDTKNYFDAVFGKGITNHVLGLFAVNENATPYTSLNSDEDILAKILSELDEIFAGRASQAYLSHVIQNWSNEPFIGGSYSWDFESDSYDTMSEIFEPVADKVFFAGEAVSQDNQATVHGACESAFEVIERMMS